jgi:hypothetical protein
MDDIEPGETTAIPPRVARQQRDPGNRMGSIRNPPVLPYEEGRRRARFDAVEHTRWLRQFWKRQLRQASTDERLTAERDE